MPDTQAAIIGAGPNGLSISAHLSALGLYHSLHRRAHEQYVPLAGARRHAHEV